MSHDVRPHYDTSEPPDQPVAVARRERSEHGAGEPEVHALLVERRGLPWMRGVFALLVMAAIVTGAMAGGLYWRLGKGPLPAPFLVDQALQAIATKLPPGYRVDLGQVFLMRRNGALAIMLGDLALRDGSGTILASAPQVDVEIDALSILLGRVEPRAIAVEGATAAASVDKDGHLEVRAGETGGSSATPAGLTVPVMMNALDAVLAAAGSLDTIELRDASLIIHDRAFGRESAYHGIAATVRRTAAPDGLSLSLAAGGGTIDATIESRGQGTRLVDVQARGIALRQIASGLAPGARPPDLNASLDAVGRARIGEDGTVEIASLDVTSPGGSWRVEPGVPPFFFDRAALALRWDGAAKVLVIDNATLSSGEGSGSFSGRMTPPAEGEADWTIALDAPGLTIAGSDAGDVPLKLDVASIRGRYNAGTRVLGIDHAQFGGPIGGLAIAGSVSLNGDTPGIGLGLAADRMSVTALKRFWPFFAVPPARKWFLEHATGGILEKGTLSLAIAQDALVAIDGVIPPLPDQAVKGEMTFSQSSVSLVDTLPPVTGIAAHSVFSARKFSVDVSHGTVDLGEAGALALTQGVYEIADLVPTPAMQHVEFDLAGPAAAAAALMTRPPLDAASKTIALEPDGISGKADLHIALDFPTLPKLAERDFAYRVTGELSDFGVKDFEGQSLEKAALKLAVEPGVILLTGKATLAGLPARIDYRKAASSPAQITLTTTLDDAARKKRGLDFGDGLNGPVSAEIRVQQTDAGPRYGVDVDFAAARVKDLLPGWQKAAGRPGKASFIWVPKGDGGTINDFDLDSGSVSLRGDITLGADQTFRKGVFSSVRLAAGDDAAATMEAVGDGWKLGLKGRALDLRPILTMLQKRGGAAAADGDVSVDIALDRALGFGNEALSGFEFGVETKAKAIRRFSLKGSFGTRGIAGGMRNAGNGAPEIYVETVDAGSMLRFLDYYTHVDGGVLQAALSPRLDRTSGQVFVRDFVVSNEPALGQYRTSLQQSGKDGKDAIQNSVQDSNSARFDKLRLTFERSADRLAIAEAVVWGPEIGANLTGIIDYAADKVNLTGTFVPAYSLNNLFSQIPVLGMILGGGQHEGLFAITFKVSGAASAPTLTVNPLSAIAPGFLRKLFDFQKQ